MLKKWTLCSAVLLPICVSLGCSSSNSSSSSASAQPTTAPATQPAIPIPPDSPFAKVKIGMGFDEVSATIGPPTSTFSYATGKAWIPFHFGGDNSRMTAYYKGIGTITFSQNSAFTSGMSAVEIDYDPTEPGFHRG
jgi:hypothetical protein